MWTKDRNTDILLVLQSKVQPRMVLGTVTWSVDQGFQKYSDWRRWHWRRWRWNDRGGIGGQHQEMSNHRFSINCRLIGHTHVNQTYPDVVRKWRQFHGCPVSVYRFTWIFCTTSSKQITSGFVTGVQFPNEFSDRSDQSVLSSSHYFPQHCMSDDHVGTGLLSNPFD